MKVARKTSMKTRRRCRVASPAALERAVEVLEYKVVKSWTVTSVAGQYIAGGVTSRFCSMPAFGRQLLGKR